LADKLIFWAHVMAAMRHPAEINGGAG
jgi:hypothetical protein